MTQIEEMKPLSRYERQRLLNEGVRLNTDFNCSDQEFFTPGKGVRIRPPRPDEHAKQVDSVRAAGLTPMIIVNRASMAVQPRPIALLGLTETETKL